MNTLNGINRKKLVVVIVAMVLLEVVVAIVFFSIFPSPASGSVGEDNVTVITKLEVGNNYPEVLNVSIEDDAADFSLTPNDTTKLTCTSLLRDWNGDGDINHTRAELFDNSESSYGDSEDNNYHYTNSSCNISSDFGTWNGRSDNEYLALANCTFEVEYYANPENWNCTVEVNDSYGWEDKNSDLISINKLLALGLPDSINYGTVNATEVSDENETNVTNYGNVEINLSLSGYAREEGDGLAMNCTLGSDPNISIEYEKFNLTNSNPSINSLTDFNNVYENLSSAPTIYDYGLNYRHNDTKNEAINQTYWRMYVPKGVAGTCQGNIIFGATEAGQS